jgi:arabinonate dehydratase
MAAEIVTRKCATRAEMDQIVNLPTPDNSVVRLHASDNVAVARVDLSAGQKLRVGDLTVVVHQTVPFAHKMALKSFEAGDEVIRFGQVIGRATERIPTGGHVHMHNTTLPSETSDYVFPEGDRGGVAVPESGPTFLGYPRADGTAGTRNYIAVVAASNCGAYTAQLVAQRFNRESLPPNVHGVEAFPHGHGCSVQVGPDTDQLQRTIAGVLDHPNVSGALIVGLGCEVNQIDLYLGPNAPKRNHIKGLTLQGSGGTRAAVDAAEIEVRKMIERAAAEERVEVSASQLMLGLQCGGSDAFSGISANPALGDCCDRLVAAGGTAVLGETTETFGAEQLIVSRAANRAVAERYLALVEQYKAYLRPFGSTFDDNPSPGNKDGGLTNILEKSLGAVAKGGTTPFTGAFDYAERVNARGLVFMNTPGNDPVSLSGIAAGGSNIMAFTTGRGSANGFPIAPVIKISSNSSTYHRMPEDMDINAGRIADGEAGVEQVGEEIFDFVLRVASGETTFSEQLGHNEFVPWSIGPVL